MAILGLRGSSLRKGVGFGKKLLLPRTFKREVIKQAKFLPLGVAGAAIGGYRGIHADWEGLTPQEKEPYIKAYGSEAKRYYQQKQGVQGAVSGFIDGVGVGAGIRGAKKAARRILPMIKKEGLVSGVKSYRALQAARVANQKSRGFFQEMILPFALETGAVVGAANAYGEVARRVRLNRGLRTRNAEAQEQGSKKVQSLRSRNR